MRGEIGVFVRLFGVLRDQLPASADRGQVEILVPAGVDAKGVLARIGILTEGGGHLVVLVNGHQVGLDYVLEEDDVLSAFPALAGG